MIKVFAPGLLVLFLLVISSALFAAPLKVFVSIMPQKYFVEKIGKDLVDVSVMVEPGANPHHYEPKPKQMVAISKTRIYFSIGVTFEKVWLEKIAATNPQMRIVHTEASIEKIPMRAHGNYQKEEHHQYEKDEHQDIKGETPYQHNGIKDPHVWLSPPLVMLQARNILKALGSVDPVHRSGYDENYKNFIMELVDLDEELRSIFSGKGEGIQFMVFHPAWGYFGRAYGLEQVPVEIEGKEPKAAELKHLIEHAKERGIKVIFVQPQLSSEIAKTIAKSIGGQVVFVDPLALDWAKNLGEVARKFRAAIK